MTSDFNFENESSILEQYLTKQNINKRSILDYMDKIASSALSEFNSESGDTAYHYLNDIKSCLEKVDVNIEAIKSLQSSLNLVENYGDVPQYRAKYHTIMSMTSQNDNEIQQCFNNLIYHSNSEVGQKDEVVSQNNLNAYDSREESTISSFNTESELEENTLVISEKKQCVILPFSIKELNEELEKNSKYENIEEIIAKKYTLPLSHYKFSSISRFKEAYSLVRKRSNGSIKDAFELGIELFFKYDLNPAIITACRNIDELDIYLSCLEDNEVDKFYCFNIKFETMPILSKKHNKHGI